MVVVAVLVFMYAGQTQVDCVSMGDTHCRTAHFPVLEHAVKRLGQITVGPLVREVYRVS